MGNYLKIQLWQLFWVKFAWHLHQQSHPDVAPTLKLQLCSDSLSDLFDFTTLFLDVLMLSKCSQHMGIYNCILCTIHKFHPVVLLKNQAYQPKSTVYTPDLLGLDCKIGIKSHFPKLLQLHDSTVIRTSAFGQQASSQTLLHLRSVNACNTYSIK